MSQAAEPSEFTRDRYDLDRSRMERLLFAAMEVSQAASCTNCGEGLRIALDRWATEMVTWKPREGQYVREGGPSR